MTFDKEFFSLGRLDALSYGDTIIHRLDPRAKVIAILAFVIIVVSFPKYAVTGLLPFFLFPVLLMVLADIPVKLILKKVLVVSPFAAFIGIFNPVFDARPMVLWNGLMITAGWTSFVSIMIKFVLTISAALILIATTSFPGVCFALRKIGMPQIFISQLLFLYRYLFVLTEEAMRLFRAHELRSFDRGRPDIRMFARLTGILFIRTIERAERIFQAMLARGFTGEITPARVYAIGVKDVVFVLGVLVFAGVLRSFNIARILGEMAGRLL
jgi:cobalt/nickel transport system permease protein